MLVEIGASSKNEDEITSGELKLPNPMDFRRFLMFKTNHHNELAEREGVSAGCTAPKSDHRERTSAS
jgi:hypothetical protein